MSGSPTRTALIVGATGLVGRHCLERLLAEPAYARVTVVGRRATGRTHEKLAEVVTDLARLAEHREKLAVDDVFCCLGTTIKVAGSQEAFRRIDHDHVLELARLAREGGAKRFGLVSSVDAKAGSLNFYLRTKGETERDVIALGFDHVEVLRPSFLVGERGESRPGERIAIAVSRPLAVALIGPLRKYRPIDAATVGAGLVGALLHGEPGHHVRHFDEIVAFSRR